MCYASADFVCHVTATEARLDKTEEMNTFSWSDKEKYQGHRGQRSRSLCNFIGKKIHFFFLKLMTYMYLS